MMRSVEGSRENRMQRANFDAWGCLIFMMKTPVDQTQKGTPYGVGVQLDETGMAGEEKKWGTHQGSRTHPPGPY